MNRTYTVAILCIIALTGCAAGNRYQLSRDDAGRVIRLDTQTGDVMLVEGDRLIPVQAASVPKERVASPIPQVMLPAGGKAWQALSVPHLGTAKAALITHWQAGKLHYVLELYPWSKRLKLIHSSYYPNSSFSLMLDDAAGRNVAHIDLPTERLSRVMSSTRSEEELSAEGDIPMSKEDYDRIASWQLLWNP